MMSPQSSGATEDGIVDDLSSLRIVNPNDESLSLSAETPTQSKNLKRRLSVRFALLPAGSLASLSSTSSEIVERLLQPGMMSSVSDDENGQSPILQWRRTLTSPKSPPEENTEASEFDAKAEKLQATNHTSSAASLSRRMPCTLQTPTPSFESTEFLSSQHSSDSVNRIVFLDPEPERKPTPLARTMSADERSLFLDNLTQSSGAAPAMLFSIPLVDIKTVERDAGKLGFSVRVLSNGGSQEHRWVILAKEEGAANFLEKRLTEEEEEGRKTKGRTGHLGAAASGALVGAVATFTGLAFS
jgi:transposase-like protein